MLADDLYRPQRLKQEVKDIPKWRVLKEAGINDLTIADTILDKILGPKDKKLDVDREKRPKPPEQAFEMRAKVLGQLGKIETDRSNDPTDKFADDAGKHFVQAITAWDEYAPLRADSKVLRSKPVYANLLQLYSDYSLYAGLMAAKHPDPKVKAFMLAQWSDAETNIANNRRLVTNVPR
jgi:hypothetical protein